MYVTLQVWASCGGEGEGWTAVLKTQGTIGQNDALAAATCHCVRLVVGRQLRSLVVIWRPSLSNRKTSDICFILSLRPKDTSQTGADNSVPTVDGHREAATSVDRWTCGDVPTYLHPQRDRRWCPKAYVPGRYTNCTRMHTVIDRGCLREWFLS